MKLLAAVTSFALATFAAQVHAQPPQVDLVLPWYNGSFQNIGTDFACLSNPPIQEIRVQGYAGFSLLPPNRTPAVGEVFYTHLVLSHPGNPCAGSAVGVGVILPSGVSLAISTGNPVFCFARNASGTIYDLSVDSGYGCPQVFSSGPDGSLSLIPPHGGLVINGQKSYTWGMAQGFWLEFLVPVKASVSQAGNNSIAWRVNPDIGVVGYPNVPVIVNNDVVFRTAMEDNELTLDIAF